MISADKTDSEGSSIRPYTYVVHTMIAGAASRRSFRTSGDVIAG